MAVTLSASWIDRPLPIARIQVSISVSDYVDPRTNVQLEGIFQLKNSMNEGDNLNKTRCEASRYFRRKKITFLKDKINELATNSKNKNIRDLYRGIKRFKRGYQPESNLVKDEKVICLQIPTIF
jgi:hypothetical protein